MGEGHGPQKGVVLSTMTNLRLNLAVGKPIVAGDDPSRTLAGYGYDPLVGFGFFPPFCCKELVTALAA